MGLAGSIIEGGGRFGKVVLCHSGAPGGGIKGGIKRVEGISNGCEEPWTEGGYGGGGEGVLATGRAERGSGRLWLGVVHLLFNFKEVGERYLILR